MSSKPVNKAKPRKPANKRATTDNKPAGTDTMSQLVGQGSRYTDEQRRQAAIQYAIEGSLAKIEQDLGIPDSTMCDWLKQDWCIELIGELRTANQDRHISQYHELTRKALSTANRGIDELAGDKLSAADIKALVVTGATATDKARLLMNQPTSIRGDSDSIKDLAAQFAKIEQDHNNIKSSVVAVQGKE